jgi:hypothetical protein
MIPSKRANLEFSERTKKLIHQVEDRLPTLSRVARKALRGNENAIMALVEIASLSTSVLEEVALYHIEHVRRWAREDWAFPLLVSPHPEFLSTVSKRLELLEVGKSAHAPAPGVRRAWSIKTPANQIVFLRLRLMREIRASLADPTLLPAGKALPWSASTRRSINRLPDSEEADKDGWFDCLWATVLDETSGHPELNQKLAVLGINRKDRYISKKGISSGKARQANIRDGIKKRLRQAFDLITDQNSH